ncbi:hypothetical protein [Caldalkalibacillus salinus]|uniref:hypothetical protein n=1 Tax=Caldalkalibacillus salinus TaxID=2803787 RepID=UPI001924D8AE|nr:hypothetical protein [Caldalkalibacillus salinus]
MQHLLEYVPPMSVWLSGLAFLVSLLLFQRLFKLIAKRCELPWMDQKNLKQKEQMLMKLKDERMK